jgi:2-C-methyl-D-erythritol 4-phosphate cytidylyltransferase
MKVVVIIPAAGLGTRMAAAESAPRSAVGKVPSKQFAELNGVPILVHTLRVFAGSPRVSEVCVALRKAEADSFRPRWQQERLSKPVSFVEGGEHRQQSVANALNAVAAEADDIVLVHDAVRPLVDHEIIDNVIAGVEKHGAAIAGVPAVDTVKQVERAADAAIITSTIPRERVVLAQTPQGFRFGVLKRAFDEAAEDGFIGTDEASLVERSGHAVAVVMGSPRNLKITTPADLELAEFYLSQSARRRAAG